MNWWPCCCPEDADDCAYCATGTTPSSITVTFDDWAGDDCNNPSWLNTTFTLSYKSTLCTFSTSGTYQCSGVGVNWGYGVSASITQIAPGNYGWVVAVTLLGSMGTTQIVYFQWGSGSDTLLDCEDTQTLSLTSDTGSDFYDPSSATCQVN